MNFTTNQSLMSKFMNKDLRKLLAEKVGNELKNNGFHLVDSLNKYFIYHRKNNTNIEIIQIGKDKYETCIIVSVSIIFLNVPNELTNINYPVFNEFNNGNIEKINVDDCLEKYFLKGNFGNSFHYGDVYLALGSGIVGVRPGNKKPIGIRVKKFKTTTYNELCDLIIKRLKSAYCWLDKKSKKFTRHN